MNELSFYSSNYEQARTRFLAAAATKGAELHQLPVDEAAGLFIDVALWRGGREQLLLHLSGVHGVEAFPGSAVQCAFLDSWSPERLGDRSLMLVHVANPYGMRRLRRWNADNIDLNRNFIDQLDALPSNERYALFDALLNPTDAKHLSGFYRKALRLMLRYRFSTLRQVIAQGQYSHPRGLFYGGQAIARESRLLLDFFTQECSRYSRIRGIDFHTGLGRFGRSGFYLEAAFSKAEKTMMERSLQAPVLHAVADQHRTYVAQGGLLNRLKTLHEDLVMVTQEIGTVGSLRIVKALRAENYYFHHAPTQRMESALALKHAFCPNDERWRVQAVRAGVQALERWMVDGRR